MSNKDNTAVDQAAQEAAVATAREEGRKTGLAEGAAAQLARINAILGSDAGKARPKAALSAALKSSMTAEEANAFLADLPEEKPAAEAPGGEATDFNAAMERGKPEVGATTGKKKEGDDEQDDVLASLQSLGVIAGAE